MSQRYVAIRLIRSIVVLWTILTMVFLAMRLTGDPVLLLIPPEAMSEELVESMRTAMGLNDPVIVQYFRFLRDAATLNFGRSVNSRQPALPFVLSRLPATAELAIVSTLLAVVIAFPVGILSALKHNSMFDRVVMAVAVVGQSMPSFWFGIMLMYLFAVRLRLLPSTGRGSIKHLILPSVTIASYVATKLARLVRASMLEVLRADYVRTARGKGLSERRVIVVHALRNALVPLVTLLGLEFGVLLGGTVVTETVFAWPGLGRTSVMAVASRDYPVAQAGVFVFAFLLIVTNLLVDLSYGMLDPRIRLQ